MSIPDNVSSSTRRAEPPEIEVKFHALVQSPLRAGLLRFLCARPEESFEVEALMQTFGRMRLDVENCMRELVTFGVAGKMAGTGTPRFAFHQPPSDAIRDLLDEFLERRATVSHEDRSPAVQRFREMIGRDEKMLVVFEWIRTAAKSDISVLILGPTGSGKEVVARMIHELSRRGTNKFQGVNCAALPDTLFESELFGYEKRGVHRRARAQAGTPRNGEQRDAVPRRDRRSRAHRPGQAAARARRAAVRAAGRQRGDRGQLPADLGDQPAARSVRPRHAVPRGSLLPRQRLLDPAAVASRARERHPGAGAALPRATAPRTACRSTARRSRRRRPICCCSTTGPGISASSRARSRGPRCPLRAARFAAPTSSSCTPARRNRRRHASACRRSPTPSARTSSASSKR